MADRRSSLVVPLLIITFIFLTPGPTGGPPGGPIQYRQTIQDVVAGEQHSLSQLQNSTFLPQRFSAQDSYGLNLTGFEDDRGFAWGGLAEVQARVKEQLSYALGDEAERALELQTSDPYLGQLYGNVTGFVHGKWIRSKLETNIPAPRLNLSDYAPIGPFGPTLPRPFGRNVTGESGEVRINFHERDPHRLKVPDGVGEVVTDMDLELSISDDDTLEEHELRMFGVYFPSAGQALLTTTSDKLAGIFALPHLSLSESMFQMSRRLLNASIPRAINRQLNGEIAVFNPWTSTSGAPSESPFAAPECELVVYLQQLPPSGLPANFPGLLYFLEKELRFPTGAILPSAPDVHFSMVAFSPDCGYVLESEGPPDIAVTESDHLKGTKIEIIWTHGRHHLLIFSASITVQLWLLIRQMREASTPSTRSKISFYTIAMLALGDGFTTMTFLLTSIFVHGLWVNLIGTAFVAFISVSFFGMRLLMDIWAVQAPERIRREREEMAQRRERLQEAMGRVRAMRNQAAELRGQAAGTPGSTATDTTPAPPPAAPPADSIAAVQNSNETTALPGRMLEPTQPSAPPRANESGNREFTDNTQQTAPTDPPPTAPQRPTDTGATAVFMPSDQDSLEALEDLNADPASNVPSFGALYTRFYLLLLATLFISLNAASWPSPFRRTFFTTIALLYLSFWLPQLHRNIQRNCRHALNWEFVLGQSILRLVPFAYFYGYSHNVLFAERDLVSLALLALWVWIQVVLLVSQEIVGPRWFVRKDWAPPAFDYHPVLREDEEGATMPIGFSEASAAAAGSPTATGRRGSIAREAKERPPGKRIFDCAICMQDLEVPVVGSAGSGGGAGGGAGDANLGTSLLARRTYMVTPCRHIFHTPCLEGWMKFRLQCPICRETLPPL